jgi:hypothetical protein
MKHQNELVRGWQLATRRSQLTGSFLEAVQQLSDTIVLHGRVLPTTGEIVDCNNH